MNTYKEDSTKIWVGGYSSADLKKIKDKENNFVWFQGVPNCNYLKPHYMHRISVRDFLTNHKNATSEIWILKTDNQKSQTAILVAIIGALATIIAATIPNCGCEPFFIPNPSPIVKPLPHNEDWEWEDLDGSSGNSSVRVRVAYKIIADQFRWEFGDHEFLDNGEKVKDALPKYLYSLPDFQKAIGIISVGMASEEGDTEVETDRADRRADNILLALNPDKLAQNKNIYKLNLGQHRRTGDKNEDETSYQRKIVLIGVMSWSGEMPVWKMEECLKDALIKSQEISFSSDSYSTFNLTGYKLDYMKTETRR